MSEDDLKPYRLEIDLSVAAPDLDTAFAMFNRIVGFAEYRECFGEGGSVSPIRGRLNPESPLAKRLHRDA